MGAAAAGVQRGGLLGGILAVFAYLWLLNIIYGGAFLERTPKQNAPHRRPSAGYWRGRGHNRGTQW